MNALTIVVIITFLVFNMRSFAISLFSLHISVPNSLATCSDDFILSSVILTGVVILLANSAVANICIAFIFPIPFIFINSLKLKLLQFHIT